MNWLGDAKPATPRGAGHAGAPIFWFDAQCARERAGLLANPARGLRGQRIVQANDWGIAAMEDGGLGGQIAAGVELTLDLE
jgi:hypothetical protein